MRRLPVAESAVAERTEVRQFGQGSSPRPLDAGGELRRIRFSNESDCSVGRAAHKKNRGSEKTPGGQTLSGGAVYVGASAGAGPPFFGIEGVGSLRAGSCMPSALSPPPHMSGGPMARGEQARPGRALFYCGLFFCRFWGSRGGWGLGRGGLGTATFVCRGQAHLR